MPRNTNGDFTLVPGTLVNNGDTILVSQHNPPFQDVASALTNSLDRDGRGGMRAALDMANYPINNVLPGTLPTDAATVSQATQNGVPVGTVIDFAGSIIPPGFLVCDGAAVLRSAYPALFDALGTTWGAGNGTTTFNVPDLRGRVTAGRDNMGGSVAGRLTNLSGGINGLTVGNVGGNQGHALTAAQNGPHTHSSGTLSATGGTHGHSYRTANSGGDWLTGSGGLILGSSNQANRAAYTGTPNSDISEQIGGGGTHTHDIGGSTASSGSGAAHNNVQPTGIVNKIIKAELT